MTDEHLTDRMPEVVAGGSRWTAAEASHLAACAGCRQELLLLETAAGLGRDLRVVQNPEEVARALRKRVATGRAVRHRARWLVGSFGLAAAAAIALAVTLGDRQPDRIVPAVTRVLAIPLPELDELDGGELEMVLERLKTSHQADPLADTLEHAELGDPELERMLRAEEG